MPSEKRASVRRKILRKIFHPVNFVRLMGHAFSSKRVRRKEDDPQLKLYAKMFPSGFLHYGYFDDPNVAPEDISYGQVLHAQMRYADLILDQIEDTTRPVLDVGCGMGGLLKLMTERGIPCTGVTPDRSQVAHIRQNQPDVPLEHSMFEQLDTERFRDQFGTIIHSESLQYIPLDQALRVVDETLKSDGRWIVIDYFRKGDSGERSGHVQAEFREKVAAAGFRIVREHDITANVLPGMAFAHLLGERLAIPVAEYAFDKIEAKSPALNFILEDAIADFRPGMRDKLDVVNPDVFARDKDYVLFTLERA